MGVPLKTAAFWALYRIAERAPVMQQPADRVRKASDLRNKMLGLKASQLITGRPDKSVEITQSSCTLPDGTELPLRIYRPKNVSGSPLPVVVNFHGGGWVSGTPRQSEWWSAGVAADAGVVVVSVQYRLAPEHPFPTPVEDCYAATAWVAEHGTDLDVDASRLAVMGDSAGGNMAAVVSLMARDRSGPAIAFQLLLYPSVDFVTDYPSETENATAPILSAKDLDNVPKLYLQDADPKNPYASPLFAEQHRDLPPALIQTAEYDPLRDQGPAYAAKLRDAGVAVRLTNYVDAVHGYISLPGAVYASKQALGEAAAALREALT